MGYRGYSGDRFDSSDNRGKWDDDWEKNKGPFPFSEKLGEISDKIGSTIDDTISRFRKKDRDDSPDRFSDNEEDRDRSSYNGQSKKEFKDEETVTTKSVHIVQATETTATRKRGVPSRKVDLGAAAHYTGDKSPDTTAKQIFLVDLLTSTHLLPQLDTSQDLSPDNSASDLFGAMAVASPTSPAPVVAPASTDLFDLMGPTQSLTSSQSLNFSMSSTQTLSTNVMPHPCSREWPHKALEPKHPFHPLGPITRLTSVWTSWGLACSPPSPASPVSTPSSKVRLTSYKCNRCFFGNLPSDKSVLEYSTCTYFSLLEFPGNQLAPNMLSQGFASMNLGPTPVRPPVNAMMQPGAGMGMGMVPNQGMMAMGMSMGMPQGGMAMGMPGGMGMGLGMNPAMFQQPKHDAFADFGNFGK
ncbi:hypothetical protein GOODEAATRI_009953 [Goodea atripinnis]|uniref:Clathrin interactor 1 n=1 Tax=Goodea atripinnis TaxID=208336 RepID=A0ABV0N9D0_9TELE